MQKASIRKRRFFRTAIVSVWIAVVGIVMLWQSINYSGVIAVLAEWQFDAFGRYYPALTCVLVIMILSVPAFILLLRPAKKGPSSDPKVRVWRSSRDFLNGLVAVGGGMALLAIGMLVAMLFLPGPGGEIQQIMLDRPATALPREGATTLNGAIVYDRTAAFDTDQFLTARSARYAPIVAPGARDPNLQFFVELPPVDQATRRGATSMTGILKRGALPGEIVQLYRYAGYRVEQPFYVLHSGMASLRRPYLVVAAQLAIGALVALLFGLIQWRRERRLHREAVDRKSGLTPA